VLTAVGHLLSRGGSLPLTASTSWAPAPAGAGGDTNAEEVG
jgi:hypothetical protein